MTTTKQRPPTTHGKLSDSARHVVLPSGITSTGWPAVRDKCLTLGVVFDPWQDGAGRVILAKRADGSYACSIGGVVISIPRQVGKTFLVAAVVFALCLLRPGLLVIWTAHHSTTANETFRSMQSFARRRKVAPHVDKVLIDAMTVELRNGSRVMFGARERGFGRGIPAIGVLVFDEAQILTERAITDMVPATNTVADALVIYTGTPPKPSDPSEVFTNRRTEALSGDADDMAYIEFSAERGCDPMDRRQWAKANPSYPRRTNDAAILRMRKNLSLDSFQREALGIWDEVTRKAPTVIDPDAWSALSVPGAPDPDGVLAYGVKFSADGSTVAVAVAVKPSDGPLHVEGVHHRPMSGGTAWLVEWLANRRDVASLIVVDGKAGTGALASSLRKAGVPQRRLLLPTVEQAITAHAMLLEAVNQQTLTHLDDEALSAAVACAGRRPIGKAGGWGFDGIDGGDVTLLESVTLAHYGASTAKPRRSTSGRGTRRAVVA